MVFILVEVIRRASKQPFFFKQQFSDPLPINLIHAPQGAFFL
jgi:hypothetical protein